MNPNPATCLGEKFLSLMQYNLFMGVNEMCVKNTLIVYTQRCKVVQRFIIYTTLCDWLMCAHDHASTK